MRESIGGLFMIILLLIIIIVVVAFSTIGLSIAKAYRVKNQIISYIEEYEGCRIVDDICVDEDGRAGELIENYLASINYNNGYTVSRSKAESSIDNAYYYEVSVIASWTLPFVNPNNTSVFSSSSSNNASGEWTIKGKTDLIKCDTYCMNNNVW